MNHNLLNGKCLEDYLAWYRDVYSKEHNIHEDGTSVNYMPFSMAYGVYVDFFDSVGVCVDTLYLNQFLFWEQGQNTPTRAKARTKAIEKANDIYNNQNQIK